MASFNSFISISMDTMNNNCNVTNYSSYNFLPAPILFERPLHPIEEDNPLCREGR